MADEDILTNMTAATNDENLEIQDSFTSGGSSMKRSWKNTQQKLKRKFEFHNEVCRIRYSIRPIFVMKRK